MKGFAMTQALAHDAPSTSPMRFAKVSDGAGGWRHELRPASDAPAPAKGRRKRRVPDPLTSASAESAAQQLKLFIERGERIAEEIAEAQADLADVFAEAKATGFDPATMREIMARRKKDRDALLEKDALLEAYSIALGLR